MATGYPVCFALGERTFLVRSILDSVEFAAYFGFVARPAAERATAIGKP
jgi:hypothetical protein